MAGRCGLRHAGAGDDVVQLVKRRIQLHVGEPLDDAVDEWCRIIANIRTPRSRHLRWCNLKTLLGAWTTSTRLHEDLDLGCLWGCSAPDRWSHYVRCPLLWGLICDRCKRQYTEDPADRMHDLLIIRDGILVSGNVLWFACIVRTRCVPEGISQNIFVNGVLSPSGKSVMNTTDAQKLKCNFLIGRWLQKIRLRASMK